MVDSKILKLIARKCPNYHILTESSAKKSTVCTCAVCMNGAKREGVRYCAPLFNRLVEDDCPYGYAKVDRLGTCDHAVDRQLPLGLTYDAPELKDPTPPEAEPEFREEEGEVAHG